MCSIQILGDLPLYVHIDSNMLHSLSLYISIRKHMHIYMSSPLHTPARLVGMGGRWLLFTRPLQARFYARTRDSVYETTHTTPQAPRCLLTQRLALHKAYAHNPHCAPIFQSNVRVLLRVRHLEKHIDIQTNISPFKWQIEWAPIRSPSGSARD